MDKYLNPKNDIAFKRIFGREKNEDILIAMLNSVLIGQLCSPIKSVAFLPTFLEPEAMAKKQSIVDVLCRDSDGCQYIIEMQVAESKGFEKRAQYYASKAFISQMGEGDPYENLKEVIFLAFTDFSIFPKKKAYKSEHVTLDKATHERDLDKLSFTFIDLVKFDEQCKGKDLGALTLEEKFYYFLKHAEGIKKEEFRQLAKDKPIKHAFDELERYSWSDEELAGYEAEEKRMRDNQAVEQLRVERAEAKGMAKGIAKGREEGKEEGMAKGIAKGREEGKEEGRKEMAKRLQALGFSPQKIEEIMG